MSRFRRGTHSFVQNLTTWFGPFCTRSVLKELGKIHMKTLLLNKFRFICICRFLLILIKYILKIRMGTDGVD
ncbi:ORF279 [White spot syndrome virus]|uniref:ORF279 n=1 Tax=White spot syndrome virus TaxID=342409 RepID=A0A2D3I6F6_9VIRU|nr:ORF279 [White spot syndrome virus]